jgi:DNA-binding NarL/FixJ family response regulator
MISVSIVEDTHEIREGFRNILNGTDGFTCVSAYSNAEDALQNLFADAPQIIVMDIGLPNLNGIECVRRLKEKNIPSQVIMFTVYDDDENIFNALQAGASGYILKKYITCKIY